MLCTHRFEPRSKKPKLDNLTPDRLASVESKGFCFYKMTNGIQRHWALDSLGFPFFTHCPKANVTDDQGLIEMLAKNLDYLAWATSVDEFADRTPHSDVKQAKNGVS